MYRRKKPPSRSTMKAKRLVLGRKAEAFEWNCSKSQQITIHLIANLFFKLLDLNYFNSIICSVAVKGFPCEPRGNTDLCLNSKIEKQPLKQYWEQLQNACNSQFPCLQECFYMLMILCSRSHHSQKGAPCAIFSTKDSSSILFLSKNKFYPF